MSRLHCALAAFVAITMSVATCMAQAPVTFQTESFGAGVRAGDIYPVDLNSDGIPDILQSHAAYSGWSAILATGPGSYGSPMAVQAGMESAPQLAFAVADYNGDGIPDFAAPVYGSNSLEMKFGGGNGTFSSNDFTFFYSNGEFWDFPGNRIIATADFNGDGSPDVVAVMDNGTGPMLYVAANNGTGFFANPLSTGASGTNVTNIVVGDFNGDGHADIAFVFPTPCASGSGVCSATLHVMYGDGNLGFRDTTPYTAQGPFSISAGDLNSDGITDLFGVNAAAGRLAVFYGQTSGTFASYFSSVPAGTFGGTSGGTSPQLAMADFNADWKMDLVGFDHNASAGTDNLVFFLSTGTPGAFTTQIEKLPSHPYTTNPVVADVNLDGKPDVIVNQSDGGSSTMLVLENTTKNGEWSDCIYPAKGINVCSPYQTSASPVAFSASAASLGNIREMELWVDGTKLTQQDFTWEGHAWLHTSASLANGSHSVIIKSADIDNRTQQVSFSLNVGQPACAAPSTPGVKVCTPVSGSTVGRPIAVQASATVSGTFSRIDVWMDGVKEYTQKTTPYLSASIPALAGTHKLSIIATNTSGTHWQTAVNVTAQ